MTKLLGLSPEFPKTAEVGVDACCIPASREATELEVEEEKELGLCGGCLDLEQKVGQS